MDASDKFTVAGLFLAFCAIATVLGGAWLNVILDGLHTNTCTALFFTFVAFAAGACVCFGCSTESDND